MNAANEFICDLAEKISMPEVYLKIRTLMANPGATISDYESLVETDPMLAIRVIRIANSEFFGFSRKADNLYDAISLIGVIQLHDLLVSSLCMRTFYNIPEQIFNFSGFWRNGIQCGIASRRIARLFRLPASNRFFTLGLLVEIGHAAMFIKTPELALKALLESQEQKRSIDEIEREYFGFDYCQLGSALMRQWQLPEVYSQIIEHHLYPEQSKPIFRAETEIVNHAYHLCEKPGYLNKYLWKIMANRQHYENGQENIEEVVTKDVVDNIDQVYAMLSPPNPHGVAMSGIEI